MKRGFARLLAAAIIALVSGLIAVVGSKAWDAGLRSPKDLPGHSVAITQIGTALHDGIGLIAQKEGSR